MKHNRGKWNEKKLLNILSNNQLFIVHAYSYRHESLRKVVKRLHRSGVVESIKVGSAFYVKLLKKTI